MKNLKELLWDAEIDDNRLPLGILIGMNQKGSAAKFHRRWCYEPMWNRFDVYFLYKEKLLWISVPIEDNKFTLKWDALVESELEKEINSIPDQFFVELINLKLCL